MKPLKLFLVIILVFLFMNVSVSVEGTGISETEEALYMSLGKYDQKEVVRGCVEDQSWMKSKSREEVRLVLSRYFEGYLLEDLTEQSWKFIEQPTDWYCQSRLVDMVVLYDDGKRALAEALIGIDDLETGHNEFGRGVFGLVRKEEGWRINYAAFYWQNKYNDR
ncbi:MAG: hypothetical protein JL50_02750 [Peptococcaceae bacterium BICA1-7]|nr:MAG: hypothetical protein JL50_02750 [Peptococcaceae bacterium BICA1-7]HBV97817.1 hypothetical protein [Desulfotomaculum sp.]